MHSVCKFCVQSAYKVQVPTSGPEDFKRKIFEKFKDFVKILGIPVELSVEQCDVASFECVFLHVVSPTDECVQLLRQTREGLWERAHLFSRSRSYVCIRRVSELW